MSLLSGNRMYALIVRVYCLHELLYAVGEHCCNGIYIGSCHLHIHVYEVDNGMHITDVLKHTHSRIRCFTYENVRVQMHVRNGN